MNITPDWKFIISLKENYARKIVYQEIKYFKDVASNDALPSLLSYESQYYRKQLIVFHQHTI